MNRRSFVGGAVGVAAIATVAGRGEIHRAGDGLPPRRVFVNGLEIEKANYADTRRGIVRAYHQPYRIDRAKGEVTSYELTGDVRVEFI